MSSSDSFEGRIGMISDALRMTCRLAVCLLGLSSATSAAYAQFACNAPPQGFGTGIPAGWSIVDSAGNGIVWGNLAACGEAGNYTGGAGDAACVSSDFAGRGEFDTELRSPVFSLAGATSASLDFNANYQSFAGSDFLDVDVSTDGGATWTTLVRWNEDHGAFRTTPGEFARIALSPFLGMSNLMLRWKYYDPNSDDWDWYAQLDDVRLTCPVCAGTLLPDPLADGSFEAGSPSAAWAEASTNFGTPLCSTTTCGFSGARSGSWWAFLGGTAGVSETASLEQTVAIGPGTANLTFFLWIPESSGNGTDALRVRVDGTQVLSVLAGNSIYASAYSRVLVDVSAFADGGTHTIRFEATTSGSPSNTNFFVDDVSVSICEPPPTALAVSDVSATEGGNLTFTVTLAPASANTVTVDYATADGTATAGADYTAASGTLQFLPGETSKTVAVAVAGDTLDELDETLSLNLSNAINASIADGQGIGNILDDDTSAVSIGSASVAEGNAGTAALSFAVSLSPPSSRTVTVDHQTANGTATAGTDYTASSGTVTFAPGETSKTVTVSVLGDVIDESDETLSVTLSNPTNAVLGSPATGVGTIVDDDTASLTIGDAAATEGNSGSVNAVFTVSLTTASSQTVTVQAATANGTASAGADYIATGPATLTFAPGQTSQSFAVPVLGDTLDELDETFVVNLSGASGATVGDAQGIGTIVDDDTSSLSVSDATQPEGNTGTSNMVFTVSLAPANSRTVTVQFQTAAGGTATAGTDYQAVAATTVTFLAGETSKTINVPVVGDAIDESNETVFVSLTSPTIAVLGDAAGVGTIVDDDTASLAVNDPSVTEGDTGTTALTFTVSLSGTSDHTVTVDFQTTAGGTATVGTDYQAVTTTTLTFAAGETSKTAAVTVNGDLIDEVNETILATLTNASGSPIGDGSGTGTIVDDDTSNITINDVTVAEGNSGTATATFTVTLSKVNSRTVTVDYATANGTAAAGSDYVAVATTTLSFAPGETSKTISVTVNSDTVDEPNETFFVNLTNATNATITDTQGVGTILDDDTSISDALWVSANGNDANDCSKVAPCRTFSGALAKSSAGGKIEILDSGDFGPVTIDKSITIANDGVGTAGVQASATNGITINAGINDVVILHGLDIGGLGTGLSGIKVLSAGMVRVENCTIHNFTTKGIDFEPASTTATTSQLQVSNAIIRDNTGASSGGILIKPGANVAARGVIENTQLRNNLFGLRAEDNSVVAVKTSTAASNTNSGFIAVSNVTAVTLDLDSCVATVNGWGIKADNPNAKVRITNCTIAGNSNGLTTSGGGNILSFGNNKNADNGTPTGIVTRQ
jgi:Calx-beta domain-containing protein